MKVDILVRLIEPGDVGEACEVLNEIIRIGGTTALEGALDGATFSRYYVTGDDLISCHVVLDMHARVAGFQWIGRNPKLPKDCADIATFTRRTASVRGTGTALFQQTKVFARKAGYKTINATIRADNTPGLGYYAKMGFADYSVARAVLLQDGTPVDRISKRLTL